MKNTKGFTLVELLIALGILGIITTLGTSFFSTSIGRNELVSASWEVVDTLRRAQTTGLSGKGNTEWGVHFETTQYVLFDGGTYSAADPDNVFFVLNPVLEVSAISLNGGGVDVLFDKNKGTTNQFGTVTLLDTNSGETKDILISEQGVFTIQ